MRFTDLSNIAVMALIPLASAQDFCRSGGPSAQTARHISRTLADEDKLFRRVNGSSPPPSQWARPISVPVYFHAAIPTNASADFVSEATLQQQFAVLQDAYASHDITFTLAGTSRTVQDNITTFADTENEASVIIGTPNPAIEAWWREKRTGTSTTLHIFVYASMDFMGISSFPDMSRFKDQAWLDAVHINAAGLPGGSNPSYNLGRTAVHEVGHWFGLLHPFGGQCDNEDFGDFVADTPRQADPTRAADGCSKTKDTCPGVPGYDNVANYMDYSADSCKVMFTAGQQVRMHNFFNSVRASSW